MVLAKGIPVFESWDNLIVAMIAIAAIVFGASATIKATRSKVRVKARAGYIGDDAFFFVKVINKGAGAVSVQSIRMLVHPRYYNGFHSPSPLPAAVLKGPSLPYTLKGEDTQDWSIQPHMALDYYQAHEGFPTAASPSDLRLMKRIAKRNIFVIFMQIRARVDLGNGKRIKSPIVIGSGWIRRVGAELLLMQINEAERRKQASNPRPNRAQQLGSPRKRRKRTQPKRRK